MGKGGRDGGRRQLRQESKESEETECERTWIETRERERERESGVKVRKILSFLDLWSLVGHLMRIEHAIKQSISIQRHNSLGS